MKKPEYILNTKAVVQRHFEDTHSSVIGQPTTTIITISTTSDTTPPFSLSYREGDVSSRVGGGGAEHTSSVLPEICLIRVVRGGTGNLKPELRYRVQMLSSSAAAAALMVIR